MAINLSGKVIKGEAYGRKLGFPTANLDRRDYSRRKLKIRLGIYAGEACYMIRATCYKFKAALVIGPMDASNLPKLEAHLLGFKGNLYNKKLTLNLVKYIRPFKQFKNETELKKQIKKDILLIKTFRY